VATALERARDVITRCVILGPTLGQPRSLEVCDHGLILRRASLHDALGIARVHVWSWQSAYRGLLPQDYLDTLTPARRRPGWERIIRDADWPRSGTIAAEAHGPIIGFVDITPTRDSDSDPTSVGELTSIYVLPTLWGKGIGRQLMATAVNIMTDAGFDQATLWVLHTNLRARHFYDTAKWRLDGATREEEIGGVPINEVRYRRPLP